MVKHITYKGLTTSPSDYECPDGELSASFGIIREEDALRPICKPALVEDLSLILDKEHSETAEVILIHRPNQHYNYVLKRTKVIAGKESVSIYYWPDNLNIEEGWTLYNVPEDETLIKVEAIGNTLAIITSKEVKYAIYTGEFCEMIGPIPDLPVIDFRLAIRHVETWPQISLDFRPFKTNIASPVDDVTEIISNEINSLLGNINKMIEEKNADAKNFMYPFFIRYAFKLYDGTITKHSSPILMTPAAINPIMQLVQQPSEKTEKNYNYTLCQYKIKLLSYNLVYEIQSTIDLTKWKDIIKSVEIYISQPLYTYDMSPDNNEYNSDRSKITQFTSGKFFSIEDRKIPSSEIFNLPPETWALIPPLVKRFNENVSDCSTFYLYSEIGLDKFAPSGQATYRPYPKIEKMTDIVQQKTMSDDFISNQKFTGMVPYTYNSRLHLASFRRQLFNGHPLESSLQFTTVGDTKASFRIHIKKNGQNYTVGLDNIRAFLNMKDETMYFFYPDPGAYRLDVFAEDGSTIISVELKQHNFLYGAYYFNNFKPIKETTVRKQPLSLNTTIYEGNMMYVSEVNNPFVFPAANAVSIGSGNIIALSSPTKALSQGQFGQFPLYAFTTDGIWAINLTQEGKYSSVQPISRDVCNNPKSVTQTDDAVLYTTDSIMIISGSSTASISRLIDLPDVNTASIPHIMEFAALSGYNDIGMVELKDFIQGCRMIYDFSKKRIIVYNKSHKYAYVYSLIEHTWGQIESNIVSNIDSYTEALAVDADNRLLDFSKEGEVNKGFIITRPLKLESHNLKSIDTILTRGDFAKGKVKMVLYASRDLKNWFVVKQSASGDIRNVIGTPFKYFRIAMITQLDKEESIFGATLSLREKFTNKLR